LFPASVLPDGKHGLEGGFGVVEVGAVGEDALGLEPACREVAGWATPEAVDLACAVGAGVGVVGVVGVGLAAGFVIQDGGEGGELFGGPSDLECEGLPVGAGVTPGGLERGLGGLLLRLGGGLGGWCGLGGLDGLWGLWWG
jgi:hypothetical protein